MPRGLMWSGTMSLQSVNTIAQMAHLPFREAITWSSNIRLPTSEQSSRYLSRDRSELPAECRILRTSFSCDLNSINGRLVSSHSGIVSDSPRIATAPVACIPKRESRSYRPVRVRSGALSQRVSQERPAIDKPSSFFCLGHRQDSGPDWS